MRLRPFRALSSMVLAPLIIAARLRIAADVVVASYVFDTPEHRRIPGLVLFRWDAPLFFANAELFRERVLGAVASSPTPVRWVVVAAEPVTSVDVTAADIVVELTTVCTPRAFNFTLRR